MSLTRSKKAAASSRFLNKYGPSSNFHHYLSGGLEPGELVLGEVVEFGEVVVGEVGELGGRVVDPGEVVVLGDVVELGEVVLGEVTIGALPFGTQGVVAELLVVPDPALVELVLLVLEVELLLEGAVELEGWLPALLLVLVVGEAG